MSATYTKPGSPTGEAVSIMRNAMTGDPGFTNSSQVLVQFGDGHHFAVDRDTLTNIKFQTLPPDPSAPAEAPAAAGATAAAPKASSRSTKKDDD